MRTKKIIALVVCLMMLSSVALAATGDVYRLDGTLFATANQMNLSSAKQNRVNVQQSQFLYEGQNGKLYSMVDAFDAFDSADADWNEFLNNLETKTPVIIGEEELKVVSVSAINAGQVKIVFNKEVDEKTIIPANFYLGLTKDVTNKSLADLNTTDYSVVLQKDEKTVIISGADLAANVIWKDENTGTANALETADGPVLENRTVYVQIKDIKTKDGKLASAMEGSFVAKDEEGPKFAKTSYTVEKVDVDSVAITFNEPVVFENLGAASNKNAEFYLNGTNVTAYVDYATKHAETSAVPKTAAEYSALSIDLAAANIELEEGNNTFEVVGLQDLAGNATIPNRITTTIKVEEKGVTVEAPKVIAIDQVSDAKFHVIFDKPVDGGDIIIKNLENDNVDKKFVIGTDVTPDSNYVAPKDTKYSAYLVEFDVDSDYTTDEVYKGANEIIRTVEVKDYYINHPTTGNQVKGANHSKAYKFVKDNKAPTVADYEIDSNDVVVEFYDAPFNGPVKDGTPTDKMVVKYVEDGITYTYEITAPTGVDQDNKLVLGLDNTNAAKLFKDGTTTIKPGITFTVKLPYGLVEDDDANVAGSTTPKYNGPYAFIGDTITVTTPGSSVGETVPQTGQAQVEFNTTLNAIQVKFVGENLDAATVTNKANYTFDGADLPKGTTIDYTLDDSKPATDPDRNIAYIYLPANSVERDGNYKLTIKGVATKGGAEMLPTDVWVYNVPDNTQPVMTSAVVTSDNTVEVTFNETLDVTPLSSVTNAERNFFVVINGVRFNVESVTAKTTRTLVLKTVDTFDYSKTVSVEIVNDVNEDMFVKDLAKNPAAEKVVKATVDIQE